MILTLIEFDTIDDSDNLLDDQILQTVLLIEVCVHVLLHRFFGHARLGAFLIILLFLSVSIINDLFKLLQS